MVGIKIGAAEVDYAPEVGLPILGNLRKDYASRGTHDPLRCRALVLADTAGTTVALISMDVCLLDRNQVAFMRRLIAAKCSIPAQNILIAATHTHGGPATAGIYSSPKAEDEKIKQFLTRASQAALDAFDNLRPADAALGYAREDRVSFNRRLKSHNGATHMNWEDIDPASVAAVHGPIDPELIVLSAQPQGRSPALLVNFSLHPAILDYENSLYTADYPGYLAQALRQIVSDDCVPLFFNGCCGNVNHIDYTDQNAPRRGFPAAQRVGYLLAAAAAHARNCAVPLTLDPITVSHEVVTLPRFRITEQQYRLAQSVLETTPDVQRRRVDGLPPEFTAPTLIQMYQRQHEDDSVEVMVIRLGELAVVALPGEVFCELGLRIKQQSPAPHTIVIELANDFVGYLPTADAFDQGGYEVTPGATNYAKGAAEKLTASAIQQLEKLFHNGR